MGDFGSALGMASGGSSIGSSIIDAKLSRDQMRLSRQALDEQKRAASAAQGMATEQQRRNEEARARASRKAPNIAAILLGEQELAGAASPTSLSGPRGAAPLANSTLLGG